jgi:hypothetical protein
MYGLRLVGWMFVTLAVCGLILPMIPSKAGGEANSYSVGSVVLCVVLAALGGLLLAKTRRAD